MSGNGMVDEEGRAGKEIPLARWAPHGVKPHLTPPLRFVKEESERVGEQ